ncbi:PAS domain-containing sensor histidine kinase [Tenacibaculum sediminilitoris]|uniref:PAS domain-containing sensor histidine kinase n=1 Tax=Tenacibaculum sediminilitoris TaxID=1820334 RepID=UPI0038B4A288
MSIHTSIGFLIISYLLIFDNTFYNLKKFYFSDLQGSIILRKSVPITIIFPLLLGFSILKLIQNGMLNHETGIVLFTLVLMLSSFIIFLVASVKFNKVDYAKKKLTQNILNKNIELSYYKNALDKVASVTFIDENGIIKYTNTNFCNLSKYSKKEVLGKKCNFLFSEQQNNPLLPSIIKIISKEGIWNGEIKKINKDGNPYWTNTAIVPLQKNSNINEFMCIEMDITTEKKATELLASKYVETLQQKNQELQQFSYIASHDLQEPLRTINSFSKFLYDNYADQLDGTAKTLFSYIKQATHRMSKLIKNLLEYSKIEHHKKPKKVNCNTLIEEIKLDFHFIIQQKKVIITYDNLPVIHAYKSMLRMLFQNLINNAIKFSKKDSPPVIEIHSVKQKNSWLFSIKDNGIGIKKEFHDKIFSIFQRLHSGKKKYKGTGIGLAHCKKIIHLHGGELWVESKLNEGSTFYFTIPNLK